MWYHYVTLAEYNLMHVHRLRHYPKTGRCEFCESEGKTQWSNKSGEYRSADDTFDWQELCPPCHSLYDKTPTVYMHAIRKECKDIAIKFDRKKQAMERLKTYAWYVS